ncbi:MAG: hypothetical protein H6742_09035 [Alphaproteobacteria bacterium]|nr:hypothetical protein [Alphaproteobacteria bacterium]
MDTARFLAPLALPPLALLAGCHVGGGDRSWDIDPTGLQGVELRVVNGSIDVVPTPSQYLTIEWSGGGIGNARIHPEPERIGDVLVFDARCGETCGGDVIVYLPDGLDVSATVEKGDVWIELAEKADVRGCTAMGSVDLVVPAGAWDMSVDVGAGSMFVDGVVHDPQSAFRMDACVAAGDLWITGY